MKAGLLTTLRQPIKVIDIDKPEIKGPHDVLLRIVRTGVCYRDILTVEGFFPRVKLPIILGHEIAGIVEDVGEAVTNFKRGDKVVSLPYIPCGICDYCKIGKENLCKERKWFGEHIDGSYAEYILTKEWTLEKIPNGVGWEEAAISACVTGMVVHALKDQAEVKEYNNILITGAGGGVGIHAVQIAKAYHINVIAVTTSPYKEEVIWHAGADDVIVLTREQDFAKVVKEKYGGVDIVLDTVGEPTFQSSLRSLKWGGKLIIIGNINVKPVSLQLGLLILRENKIIGNISSTKNSLREALRLYKEGLVKAIGETLPLEKINEAHEKIKNKQVIGRVFITI